MRIKRLSYILPLAVALLARLGRLGVLLAQLGVLRGYVRFLVRFL